MKNAIKRRTYIKPLYFIMWIILLSSIQFHPVVAQTLVLQTSTPGSAIDVAWSPDSQILAVATSSGVVALRQSLQEKINLPGYTNRVRSLSWNQDGSQIAGAGIDDGVILIWNWNSSTNNFDAPLILHDPSNPDYVTTVAWSPDGTRLAALIDKMDYIMSELVSAYPIWNTSTWVRELTVYGRYTYASSSLVWSLDSTKIAGGGDEICPPSERGIGCSGLSGGINYFVADAATGERLQDEWLPTEPGALAWSPMNRLALDAFGLQIFDVSTGQLLSTFDTRTITVGLEWMDNGADLIRADSNGLIEIRDSSTGTLLLTLQAHNHLNAFDLDPTETRLATASDDGTIQVWNLGNVSGTNESQTLAP